MSKYLMGKIKIEQKSNSNPSRGQNFNWLWFADDEEKMNQTEIEKELFKLGLYSKAEITIKINISNILNNKEAIHAGFSGFEEAVEWLIKEEGNFVGLMDDDWEIISIKEVTYDNLELSSD